MGPIRIAVIALAASIASAQNLGSLKTVPLPRPAGLDNYVRDQTLLLVLGKALFWDMQAGSDGRVACASCHFHAGADHRVQNQLVNAIDAFPVNHTLTAQEFPFRVLADVNDNRSATLRDSAAVAGSAGLFRRIFVDLSGTAFEDGYDSADAPSFSHNGVITRRVTGRNSPSVINSVFNARNFWDGRASSIFTGLTPFGDSDSASNVVAVADGQLARERFRIDNSSLASQAVGPALSDVEMSYQGRTWPKLGKKMLGLRPLAMQIVSPEDSVLGPYTVPGGRGLQIGYLDLIQAAFQPQYWNTGQLVDGEYTLAEYNFALFWGLAIQAYEATLVSDDAPFDRFSEGANSALTVEQQDGLRVFRGQAGCTNNCHIGPEFTAAGVSTIRAQGAVQNRGNTLQRDRGYFRIGVRPVTEDIGLAADDAFGRPLSIATQTNEANRASAQGAFKTPSLRNVEFTGPYFHNGGQATLEQVVDFYMRGGDFPDGGNLGTGIRRRNVSPQDRRALVEFLKSLSDERVRYDRAPFDHPELCVSTGHIESSSGDLPADASDSRFPLSAIDRWAAIPATGRDGHAAPLQTFDELLLGLGSDGSRSHTLTDACSVP